MAPVLVVLRKRFINNVVLPIWEYAAGFNNNNTTTNNNNNNKEKTVDKSLITKLSFPIERYFLVI